jgi:ATP-dependent DNA ligase
VPTRVNARFIEPMLLLRTETLADDPRWISQLKLDGYRAIAFKTRKELPPLPRRQQL